MMSVLLVVPAYLLRDGPDVGEALAEADEDLPGPAAQRRGGTVERCIACAQDNHHPPQLGQGGTAAAHA